MRSLAVVRELGPVPTSGGEVRVHHLVRTLAELGEVDVVRLRSWWDDDDVRDLDGMWDGVRIISPRARKVPSWRGHARWLLSPGLPSTLGFMDRAVIRESLVGWARPEYDAVLFDPAAAWYGLGGVVGAPEIVDLDDLKDVVTARGVAVGGSLPSGAVGDAPRWRSAVRMSRIRRDAIRWRRYQDLVAERVRSVLVASEIDQRRVGYPNAVVVPNGYDLRTPPVGRLGVGSPPTFAFPGTMRYGPNEDGAEVLVREVVPVLRELLPDAQVIIAGDASDRVKDLAAPPIVTVTGRVDRMEDVLARIDAVVVPLRVGGGTRIKIIEAWAHGIPVVSTSVGAEGLEAESGRDLLIADDPRGLARACVDVVADQGLRQRLIEAGRVRASGLTWTASRNKLRQVVLSTVGRAGPS